jgi:hypothetical protein
MTAAAAPPAEHPLPFAADRPDAPDAPDGPDRPDAPDQEAAP